MSERKRETQDQVFDHEFDGIQEYDNRLPNWWLYTLYGAIVFAVGYWFYFHTIDRGPLPTERYEQAMIKATELQLARMAGQELTDESLLLAATVPDRVAAGRQVFEQFCVVCHGTRAEGNVGPNLTDGFWIHGSRPLQIMNVVNKGVTDKGMAAWEGQLGPRRVQDVVTYVLTEKGKNVPGKAPQGEPEGTAAADSIGAAPGNAAPADTTAGDTATRG